MKPAPTLARNIEITVVVAAQSGAVVGVVEQRERREARQVDSVVEDQLRLQPSVGHEQSVAQASMVVIGVS